METRPAMHRLYFALVLFVPILLFLVVVDLAQGECGKANLLDYLTSTPALTAAETREMSAALAAGPYGAGLYVESVLGHKITLRDRNAAGPTYIRRESDRIAGDSLALGRMWQSVFARNHPNARDPITTVDIDFGDGHVVNASSSVRCVAT